MKMGNSNIGVVFLLVIMSSIISAAAAAESKPKPKAKKPSAIYAFGDSVFDAGNNNRVATVCRANHAPYGMDFPGGSATGRFSNGKLPGDILAADLGIKDLLPAYADIGVDDEEELLTGATFASACSGLDDLTAREVNVLNLDKQFKNFEKAFQSMEENFGLPKATAAVENALFMISAGADDMMENYYELPTTRAKYSLPAFHDMLLKNLQAFVKKLYNAGAKRVAIIGLPPLGCLPMDVTKNMEENNATATNGLFKRVCKKSHNSDAKDYNAKLKAKVKKMMVDMPKIKIAYMDIFTPLMEMVNKPSDFGFKTTLQGCCGTGAIELGPLCSLLSWTCHPRSEYVFWDAAHPTQTTYEDLTKIFEQKVLPNLLK